ncbi:MAG TPA: energy transducer TonB [Thermoanaerobaculia bacterium]
MVERKHCAHCGRPIDAYARICPYCNWDQNETVPAARPEQSAEATYTPPTEHKLGRWVLIGVVGVFVLIGAFVLGSRLQRGKPVKGLDQAGKSPAAAATAPVRPAPQANVTLVPDNGSDTPPVEQPITSAPVANATQGVPPEYQRSDATAVSSVEYAQLAARAAAEKKQKQAIVDPRTLTGPAYDQGTKRSPEPSPQMSSSSAEPPVTAGQSQSTEPAPPAAPTREPARVIVSTRPVPEYQPVPDIQVRETTVARLQLVVGADGRVKEVYVIQGIPGQTAKIIDTVQTWRFKPATENGSPVPSPFTVDLSFRGQ